MNIPLAWPIVLLLAWCPALTLAAESGRIKNVVGIVHLERAGSQLPATVGAGVQSGDIVVTGSSSSVGITMADDTRFSAGPNSRLVIERFRYDAGTQDGVLDARLRRGTLAVVSGRLAKQSPQAVTVRTNSMVLGVRGTEFVVAAE